MRQAWVRPRFPLGRRYTGEIPTVSPCPRVQSKGAAFLGPRLSPTPGAWWSSLSFSLHPPLVIPTPAGCALSSALTSVPSQRCSGEQSRAHWGLHCTQLSPFRRTRAKVMRPWQAATFLGPFPPYCCCSPVPLQASSQLNFLFTASWLQGHSITWNSSCCQLFLASSSSVSQLQGIGK